MRFITVDRENRALVNTFIQERWYTTQMIIRGKQIDMTEAEGLLLLADGCVSALAMYVIAGDTCEIVSLDSLRENRGIGSALIEAVTVEARARGCVRLLVVTTNDNLRAIRLYAKRGFVLRHVYLNSIDQARLLKPEIPLLGEHGIPLKHELEFERTLQQPTG